MAKDNRNNPVNTTDRDTEQTTHRNNSIIGDNAMTNTGGIGGNPGSTDNTISDTGTRTMTPEDDVTNILTDTAGGTGNAGGAGSDINAGADAGTGMTDRASGGDDASSDRLQGIGSIHRGGTLRADAEEIIGLGTAGDGTGGAPGVGGNQATTSGGSEGLLNTDGDDNTDFGGFSAQRGLEQGSVTRSDADREALTEDPS